MTTDTIAALATSAGEGGVAIIRISGPDARDILSRVFRLIPKPGMLKYGHIYSAGEVIDECMAVYLPAPRTYTREDVCEIHCHGGAYNSSRVLEAVLKAGARPAKPGEFTLRAFMNGRLSLDEAEAVMSVVRAGSESASRAAMRQLAGGVSAFVSRARASLISALAEIEAHIDFPEEIDEELTREGVLRALNEVSLELKRSADPRAARIIRDGASVVLAGLPNAGKSSIMNALSGTERAIVTDIAGTTRDIITQRLTIDGVLVELTDTAGLRETSDEIERIGVSRAREALLSADAAIIALDSTVPESKYERLLIASADERAIIVMNKCDLPSARETAGCLRVSAKTGEGLDELKKKILSVLRADGAGENQLTCARHIECVSRAASALDEAASALIDGFPVDAVAVYIRSAAQCLGEITGEDASEDVIDSIFSRFCVGK